MAADAGINTGQASYANGCRLVGGVAGACVWTAPVCCLDALPADLGKRRGHTRQLGQPVKGSSASILRYFQRCG